MDSSVLQAMARWPDVPAVFGWLSLDRRGSWRIKGECIGNPALAAFIGRNYAADESGRWYFQNGPQRVFVALAYTPWVYRLSEADSVGRLRTHTGLHGGEPIGAWLDETGNLLLLADAGIGVLDDRDLAAAAARLVDRQGKPLCDCDLEKVLGARSSEVAMLLDSGDGAPPLPVRRIQSAEAPSQFGFVADPRPAPGQPEC